MASSQRSPLSLGSFPTEIRSKLYHFSFVSVPNGKTSVFIKALRGGAKLYKEGHTIWHFGKSYMLSARNSFDTSDMNLSEIRKIKEIAVEVR